LLAAHFFLFYFAVKSGSTPPVCLVAVVAAGIADANWWKTGITAFYYSLAGFIVAFMFVFSPVLLMQGSITKILLGFITAVIGVIGISAAIQGWIKVKASLLERIGLAVFSILLVKSGASTDIVGFLGILVIFLYNYWKARRYANVGNVTVV